MKIAIVGSRNFGDLELVEKLVAVLPKNTIIVSGGAEGVDTAAEKAAKKYRLTRLIFEPQWHKFGKSAGMIRNREILQNAQRVFAFWDGASTGTEGTIKLANQLQMPVEVIQDSLHLKRTVDKIKSSMFCCHGAERKRKDAGLVGPVYSDLFLVSHYVIACICCGSSFQSLEAGAFFCAECLPLVINQR